MNTPVATHSEEIQQLRSKRKVLFAVPLVILLLTAAYFLEVNTLLKSALQGISSLGTLGIVLFILLYIMATVLFVPGFILTLGAGVLFGVIQGSMLVSIGATVGATLSFLIGRYLARAWVAGKIRGNARFEAIDRAVAEEGWKIVGLTRLSPVFPFNLLNYAYGLTQVSLKDYFLASWLGMLPGTVMYVYLGSLAGSLASLGNDGGSRSGAEWLLYIIGLVATVLLTVYITRIARQALDKKVS